MFRTPGFPGVLFAVRLDIGKWLCIINMSFMPVIGQALYTQPEL
jgi:hypothetical protein